MGSTPVPGPGRGLTPTSCSPPFPTPQSAWSSGRLPAGPRPRAHPRDGHDGAINAVRIELVRSPRPSQRAARTEHIPNRGTGSIQDSRPAGEVTLGRAYCTIQVSMRVPSSAAKRSPGLERSRDPREGSAPSSTELLEAIHRGPAPPQTAHRITEAATTPATLPRFDLPPRNRGEQRGHRHPEIVAGGVAHGA